MQEPRILTLTGTPHPKALVQRIDPATGVLVFAWLNAQGGLVDSGGSVARFTALAPLPKAEPTDPDTYPEVEDSVLIDAIQNPPPEPPSPVRLTPLEVIARLTGGEESALTTSTDVAVAIVRQRFIAATYIDTSDPRTAEGVAVLVAKGIITQERAAEIFS